jgi:hypothetical protein
LFIAGASTLITLKYKGRDVPDVAYSVHRAKDLKFPNDIKICPQKLSGNITWHYLEELDSHGSRLDANIDLSLVSIRYADWLDMDCLQIHLDASAVSIPSGIQISLVWSQNVISYSDLMLILDDEQASSSWIAAGMYNTSKGAANDIDISLEKYTYLPTSVPGIEQQWKMVVVNTPYYFYEISSNAMEIPCDKNSSLTYTKGCSTAIKTCRGSLEDFRGQTCTMMTVVYLSLKSNNILYFDEIDPVDWLQIISSLGGYWVYIGSGFGFFFAVKRGTLELVPDTWFAKLLRLCNRQKKSNECKKDADSELIVSSNGLKKSLLDPSTKQEHTCINEWQMEIQDDKPLRDYQTVFLKRSD